MLLQRMEPAEPWRKLQNMHMMDAGAEAQQKHAPSAPRDIAPGQAALQAHLAAESLRFNAEEEHEQYRGAQEEQPASAASSFYECRSEGGGLLYSVFLASCSVCSLVPPR